MRFQLPPTRPELICSLEPQKTTPPPRGRRAPLSPGTVRGRGMGRGEEQGARTTEPPAAFDPEGGSGWILGLENKLFSRKERARRAQSSHISLTPDPRLWRLLSQLCREPGRPSPGSLTPGPHPCVLLTGLPLPAPPPGPARFSRVPGKGPDPRIPWLHHLPPPRGAGGSSRSVPRGPECWAHWSLCSDKEFEAQ